MNDKNHSIISGKTIKYHKTPLILPLFEAEVKKNPFRTALIYDDQTLTYQQLNHQSNQLARYLLRQKINSGSIIGLCMERSFNLVIAIYAILKAGMVYMPIDPYYPISRIHYMLDHANATFLLTHNHLNNESNKHAFKQFQKTIFLDQIEESLFSENSENLSLHLSPDHPAYLIYTSGSTGTPKGVLNNHKGLFNRLCWMQKEFQLTDQDVVLQKTPFTFDVSVWEFFWPLLFGARLAIAQPEIHKIPKLLAQTIIKHNVSTIHFVPSMLKTFIEQTNLNKLTSLRTVICSGEPLGYILQENFFNKCHAKLYNLYGPTEASIDVTCWCCNSNVNIGIVPIGKPISNIQLYILDEQLKPVTQGDQGELYIGGEGVALCYINNPLLTSEKFIQNSFNCTSADNLYKTGDLVRQLPDGNLVFIGRIDDQVKIRGYRIEPGEIEACLYQYSAIEQAAVLAQNDKQGDKYLVAYLCPEDKANLNLAKLKSFLKDNLPDYMIPSSFIVLKALPINSNGKIDRKVLSKITEENPNAYKNQITRSSSFLSATTENEKLLAIIWSDVLNLLPHKIGIDDNFFELGGHSLSALHILIRLRLCFTTALTINDIFDNPTIEQLLKKINHIRKNRKRRKLIPFKKTSQKTNFPLSFSQTLIWQHQQLTPDKPIYNEPININFPCDIDVSALEKSLNKIVKQQDILRARFHTIKETPIQSIAHYHYFKLPFTDLRMLPKKQRLEKAIQVATCEAKKIFRLDQEPLFRFHLIQLNDKNFRLFAVFHHLIIDGITLFQLFAKELESLYYTFLKAPSSSQAKKLLYQYTDFVIWEQHDFETRQNSTDCHLSFWYEYLKNLPELNLPYQHFATLHHKPQGKRLCLSYNSDLVNQLKLICKNENTTLYALLFAAFNVLLYRYTHQTDIPIGTIVSSRYLSETERMMGNFLNTLIIRSEISENITFRELLAKTWGNLKNTFQHQMLPFQQLLPFLASQQKRKNISPIQVAFVYEPEFYDSPHGWITSQLEVHPDTCKFDLTLELDVKKNGLIGRIEYNANRFDEWFIEQLISHYEVILQSIVENMDYPIGTMPILTPQDQQKLLIEWNNTKANYPENKTIHQLFEEQVKKTPDNIAVIFEEKQLTYRELNEQSNQLAYFLRKKGVKTETLVAICVDRSLVMIVGILGILKAGSAYVPIDPNYPKTRIQYLLEDTKAPLLLTQQKLLNVLPNHQCTIVKLDIDWKQIAYENTTNLNCAVKPFNLAYAIYTSGSTGKPKGVLIEHTSVINMALEQIKHFSITQKNKVSGFASLSFDASVSEIFTALLSGATLNIIPHQKYLLDSIQNTHTNEMNVLTLPPSVLKSKPKMNLPFLQTLILAGESAENILPLEKKNASCSLINAYGPTEATVCATLFHIPDKKTFVHVPIGKPIKNVQCYIFNHSLQLLPIGIIGELYIGGVGLARGYLNQPELTKENFIPNPFGEGRLYKTGDLVRWLPDGNLEFIGRIDNQVKIRGFRIELGEIETHLSMHPLFCQCVVIAKEDAAGDKYLAAYLVTNKRTDKIKPQVIKDFLKKQLPDYMIPAVYTFLNQLPLTPNGKVDKKALPEPERALSSSHDIIKPKTATEKQLLTIWQEVLQLNTISITNNFFDLGGHSLKAIQLLSKINQKNNIALTINDILQYSTIEKLAGRITAIKKPIQKESRQNSNKNSETFILVPLKETGNKTPLFLIHPIGGTVFCYLPLTKHFDQNRPLYGLQDPSIISGNSLFNSLEEMAKHYMHAIQQRQSHGPYLLGGLSSGSTIAIEIARQLSEQNEQIHFIGLFDGWSAYPQSIQNKISLNDSLRRHHQQWREQFTASPIADLEKLFELQWQRLQLINKYQLKTILHQLTLFKAKELLSYFESIQAPYNYWDSYTAQPIEVYEVNGNHETILQEPNLSRWVNLLNDCLEKTDKGFNS